MWSTEFRGRRLIPEVALVTGGIALLASSWVLRSSSWWSSVLIGVGSTLLLFVPLLLAGRGIERMLDSVRTVQEESAEKQRQIFEQQQKTDSDVARLAEEVAHTQAELLLTREELSDTVLRRITSVREDDTALFDSVGEAPTWQTVLSALRRARELDLISSDGCRVSLFGSGVYLRFQPEYTYYDNLAEDQEPDLVMLTLEHRGAQAIRNIGWQQEESPTDILMRLAEQIQAAGFYPGDEDFRAGEVFAGLSRLVTVAHKNATSKDGVAHPLAPVIQFCPPQWVIADDGIYSIEPGNRYLIPARRLEEDHWVTEMEGKSWVNVDSFMEAFDTCDELYRSGKLKVKPQSRDPWNSDIPF